MLCASTRSGLWKLVSNLPQIFALCAFPFADFALYSFSVINYGCRHGYMLSPVESLQRIIKPRGVVLGIPDSCELSVKGSTRSRRQV